MKGSVLYQNMLQSQDEYRKAYMELDKSVRSFFKGICDEENSRIRVDEYNFIIVRVAERLSEDVIEDFREEFDSVLLWMRSELIDDFRNITHTNAEVYEYGFALKALYDNGAEAAE